MAKIVAAGKFINMGLSEQGCSLSTDRNFGLGTRASLLIRRQKSVKIADQAATG